MEASARDSSSVQVALRIRPQNNREKLEGSRVCTLVVPNEPQVTIGAEKSFTYDFVYDIPTEQETIYNSCISKLVSGLFDGFNATVLAYGQTGSGKTFTMGTAFDKLLREDEIGVIPRAIQQVFHQIVECKTKAVEEELPEPTFEVGVQFVELYNEEVIDLLSDERSSTSNIRIHENSKGEIYLHGVAIRAVEDLHSTVEILKNGALNRTVASTNMNEQSSRSHAIFSMIIKQQRVVPITPIEGEPTGETEVESLTAKFHFVDLAGSERLKRTGATGNRAKEGISINSGLLALGNVISALGSGRVGHVPYRDSKLTRLLQDSLGGNSRTLMIACVSPSDCDFVETLNTLNYANRAKNIKNKIVANQDKSSKVIGELRSRIASLEMELLEYKQGRRTVTADGSEIVNDQYHENLYLTEELNRLRFRIKTLQETIEILQNRNVELIAKADGIAPVEGATEGDEGDAVQGVVRKYLTEVETLRSSLFESQATCDQLRKEMVKWKLLAQSSGESISATAFGAESSPFASNSFTQRQLIEEARADIDKMKKSMIVEGGSTSDYVSATDDGDDGTSNDMDDIDDLDEEEDEEESESYGESREEAALRDNLNALQDDINIKERLINELEKSERRLKEVRLTYEKKLSELSLRIQQTEAERDRVLAEKLSKKGDNASQEQAKRIREEYERKLTDMKNEYKKLRAVEKEHRLMQARYNREQEQKARLVADLTDMKRQKVDLVKKLNEEAKKSRQQEMTNRKNMMAQDKAMRLRDNKIRQLENKDRQREIFMKRTTEEMQRLRQKAREQEKATRLATTPSRVVASRFNRVTPAAGRNGPPPQITFSPKLAKIKWGALEKKLAAMINKKQTTNKMEDELNRLVEERHRITDEIAALDAKFVSTVDMDERRDLEEQRDAYSQKKTYIQDQITEVQGQIVALDEANKGDGDDEATEAISEIEGLMDSIVNVVEAKYLLQHMYNNSLETGVLAANLRATKLELEARIQQLEQQRFMNEQLLSTVIEGKDKDLANDLENVLENGLRKKNRSPSLQSLRNDNPSPTGTESSENGHQKIRRRTSNVEELLYPMPEPEKPVIASSSEPTEEESRRDKKKFDPLPPSASATHPPAFQRGIAGRNTISSLPSTSRSNGLSNNGGLPPRPGLMRMKSAGRLPALAEEPRSKREKTPERQKSVFARLIPSWSVEASPSSLINRKQGRFAQAKVNGTTTRVVTRTHTAEGHSKSVMTVAATNDMMLTGSKDRTAKVWDLATGQELRTLGVHPNTVHSVRFVPNSSLALSVSTYQVRVWDLRSHQCLRVLQSSGQVIEGDGGPVGSRQNTMPFLETMINAAEVDSAGRFLFTSFAGDVRIWDIGRWASFGRLAGASHSPKSEVSCLSVTNNEEGVPFVFTGSRDHYVKMYEVNAGGEGVHDSVVEFQPPHYDNVTCTLAIGNHLYTSGKDTNIMKFSLKDFKRDHLELKAHNSYVQGMCLTGFTDGRQLLTSVCKAGVVKFWDVETTRRLKLVEEIQAHEEAIHAVCANDYLVFTASSDQTVGVWKINQTTN